MYLGFGAFAPAPDVPAWAIDKVRSGDDEEFRRVVEYTETLAGRLVAHACASNGLRIGWDGSPQSRIQVHITDWRRPLPA